MPPRSTLPSPTLPIDARLDELLALVAKDGGVVLVAEPGAGKTTRVPAALLRARGSHGHNGEVWVVEPRRLAARMAAVRVAEELGAPIGGEVGYTVRFEDRTSDRTRVRFVTEGILLRRLASDPALKGVGAVVFDEFHERNLDSDLALAWVRALRQGPRRDLEVLVMSATIDPAPVAAFLGVEVLHVTGRTYPVAVEYQEPQGNRPLEAEVVAGIRKVLVRPGSEAAPAGDILVFLPGAGEIRRAMEAAEELRKAFGVDLVPLHGDLTPDEQDRAVRGGERRKVIFSTNIAETSLTIPSVTAVVDSGLARVLKHSPWSGLARLDTVRISQASAIQRAGRAGRVGPGLCVRVYPKHVFDAAPKRDVPEIQRADLAAAELLIRAHAPASFELFEAPPEAARQRAERMLLRLGAIDEGGKVTAQGRAILDIPAHPRIAKLVLEGVARGVGARACLAAAVTEERELRLGARVRFGGRHGGGPGGGDVRVETGPSDVLARLEAFECVAAEGATAQAFRIHDVDRNAFQAIRNVRQQLARAARTDTEPRGSLDDEEPALREAIFVAYADRVGKRRSKGGQDVVFADGGAAKIAEGSVVRDAEFLVAIDVDEGTRTGPAIRVASAIEPEWLLGADGISDVRELAFDAKTERVVLRTRLMFGKLTLDESDRPAEPSPEAHAVLLAALRERGLAAVWDLEGAEGLLARWRYAASVDDSFPKADEGALETLLLEQMSEATSFAELRAVSPLDALSAGLGAARLSALRDLAPEFVNLPGRPRVPVNYEPGKPPWMESRLQDFFGMAEGPRVGRSREAIVIHLLAPNYRAVQVTTDLAGFWERHYPALRSQLMRRYPRHAWPEDPLHATPPQRQR